MNLYYFLIHLTSLSIFIWKNLWVQRKEICFQIIASVLKYYVSPITSLHCSGQVAVHFITTSRLGVQKGFEIPRTIYSTDMFKFAKPTLSVHIKQRVQAKTWCITILKINRGWGLTFIGRIWEFRSWYSSPFVCTQWVLLFKIIV